MLDARFSHKQGGVWCDHWSSCCNAICMKYCVEWCSTALSPTGHRLAMYSGPLRRHQSNDHLWNNHRRSALFVERNASWPIMHDRVNVAVNWVCAWQAMHTWHVHDIIWSLGATIITRSPILRTISLYCLTDINANLLNTNHIGHEFHAQTSQAHTNYAKISSNCMQKLLVYNVLCSIKKTVHETA